MGRTARQTGCSRRWCTRLLSRRTTYQGLLGYLNWFLPLSWPIVAVGLVFCLTGLLGAITFGSANSTRPLLSMWA